MSLFESIYRRMVRKFIRREYWQQVRQGRAEKRVRKRLLLAERKMKR